MTQQQLCLHKLAQTCRRLQLPQSNLGADCDCHHHTGTRALCSNIYCRGCLRLTFTTCSVLHFIQNECLQLSTFIVPPVQFAEAMGQATAIPEVPPPRSHRRTKSSELSSSVTKPITLTGSVGSVRLGRQEGVKQDMGTACYALLATPPHRRTCSSSPVLWCRPCPLHWGGFLQQESTCSLDLQLPW